MSLAKLYARGIFGTNAPEVIVEVHVSAGLPSFSIVGMPDTAVRESRDRVRSAIQLSGFDFPARRITVNLAPAELPKESGRYDLAIALGILIASKKINIGRNLEDYEFAGELALDGTIRAVNGALAMAYSASKSKRTFILPSINAKEASLIDNIVVYGIDSLNHIIKFLTNEIELEQNISLENSLTIENSSALDFNQVKGQLVAKKALEIAASGRHSILLVGNPGCGKSMLASRLVSILPQLSNQEAIETASIYSLSNTGFNFNQWKQIPFRQPHHSSSGIAIIGGGSNPKPGEISLAHNGVLFLDEVLEFDKKVLELLREPLETKKINISRAKFKVDYCADFQLVLAMNPCPCGNKGSNIHACKCSDEQVSRYVGKLSAPMLDRIDIVVNVPQLKINELESNKSLSNSSSEIKARVVASRELQLKRQKKLNYLLSNDDVHLYCVLDQNAKNILNKAIEKFGLSTRSYYKILKVSRTIADLDFCEYIDASHIAQALQYKSMIQKMF
jgi:magnesium chelatase family protein